jgi:hypothetical protein
LEDLLAKDVASSRRYHLTIGRDVSGCFQNRSIVS